VRSGGPAVGIDARPRVPAWLAPDPDRPHRLAPDTECPHRLTPDTACLHRLASYPACPQWLAPKPVPRTVHHPSDESQTHSASNSILRYIHAAGGGTAG
jgi:hypothetical protein